MITFPENVISLTLSQKNRRSKDIYIYIIVSYLCCSLYIFIHSDLEKVDCVPTKSSIHFEDSISFTSLLRYFRMQIGIQLGCVPNKTAVQRRTVKVPLC